MLRIHSVVISVLKTHAVHQNCGLLQTSELLAPVRRMFLSSPFLGGRGREGREGGP